MRSRGPAVHHCQVLAAPIAGVHATDTTSARHYGRHWHSTYTVGVVDRGAQRSSSAAGDVDAFEGDILCTYPGEIHDGRPLGTDSRRWRNVYLEPEVFDDMTAGLRRASGGTPVAFRHAAFTDARVQSGVLRLLAMLQDGSHADAASRLDFEQTLVGVCGRMVQAHSQERYSESAGAWAPSGAMAKVRERLADAPLNAPMLGELAQLAGVGKFQLLRQFKAAYGTTPHDWLVQRRADRARGFIREGMGLSAAATSAGFADQSHMTRVFVRRFGYTPGAWQEAHRR